MPTQTFLSEPVLFKRINKRLKPDGEKLRRCKQNSRWHNELDDYHIVDMRRGVITAWGIRDLEKLANEVGVLEPWEQLARE